MAQVQQQQQQLPLPDHPKEKKMIDPLFGPSVGVVSAGPAWTSLNAEKKVLNDELTPDVIRTWIEKSNQPSHPTTTLQALVNLKRPSLRLSPLTALPDDATPLPTHKDHHGLEFEFDCDAPQCGIYVHVLLPRGHPDVPEHYPSVISKVLVFDTIVEGGFGKKLKLEEGALLELGRFEHVPSHSTSDPRNSSTANAAETGDSGDVVPDVAGDSHNAVNGTTDGAGGTSTAGRNNRRRFTHFNLRKRLPVGRSVAGPALAVLDGEPVTNGEGKHKDGKDDPDEGVKVIIRLAALNEQGAELVSPNEQLTYLHVVRFGTRSLSNDSQPEEEDTRPWVVKVVKREATIGPHTFHLHEIYGLASSATTSTHSATPTAPLPQAADLHSYPPMAEAAAATTVVASEDEPSSECLLCLSSPREVVLLPCRHLVACKDCALNMVEFGAGGNITQAEEPVVGGDAPSGEAAAGAEGATGTPTTAAAATAPTTTTRRKRKAKGWFCPVCRQPYSSLLRITTSSPPPVSEASITSGEDKGKESGVEGAAVLDANTSTRSPQSGLLGSNFLRGLSFTRNPSPGPSVEAEGIELDVERRGGLGRVGS